MIRIARMEDLDQIMAIVKETVEDLKSENNFQWSDIYPNIDHFIQDIKNNDLFIYDKENQVAGFICINQKQDEAYKGLPWQSNKAAIVIHRFAIKRDNQRQKIGSKLLEYTEGFARNKGIYYIKVDTNTNNYRMNKLFEKNKFNFVGTIHLRDLIDKFNCYDKVLQKGENNEIR